MGFASQYFRTMIRNAKMVQEAGKPIILNFKKYPEKTVKVRILYIAWHTTITNIPRDYLTCYIKPIWTS